MALNRSVILLSMLLLCLTSVSHAEVAGVSKSGDTFTITGTSFGTKVTNTPAIKFDKFEGVDGANLSDYDSWWSPRVGYQESIISVEQPRYPGSKAVKAESISDVKTPHNWHNDIGFTTTGKFFVSLWLRIGEAQDCNDPEYQLKSFVINAEVLDNGAPTNSMLLHTTRFYGLQDYATEYLQNYGGEASQYTSRNLSISGEVPRWVQITVMGEDGTIGNSDGRYIEWRSNNGGSLMRLTDFWPTATHPLLLEGSAELNSFHLYSYIGNAGEDTSLNDPWMNTYYDDIYIDNSWAHVEIGDNQTYNSCTHREIQPVTNWSDDSITVGSNNGSFEVGSMVYLFVTDEEGVVIDQDPETPGSQGYPITLTAQTISNSTLRGCTIKGM